MKYQQHNSRPGNSKGGTVHAFTARAVILGLILVLSVGAVPLAYAQTESVIYSFADYPDGRFPLAGLVQDANGNFYGTTELGGISDNGTVFKVTPGGKEKVLFNFTRVPDGANPVAGLVIDASGNFYGTTSLGGANNGCGTVFKITPKGKHKVLYSFTCGTDGISPNGPVTLDAQGNLYGVTWQGGATGNGTVFKVTPSGKEKLLYSFTGGADGGSPSGPLVQDADGNLYGTTEMGGPSLWGTVFKLTPTGQETVIYSFSLGKDGGEPMAGVLRDAKGNLYGTASSGGGGNCAFGGCGVVFKVSPSGTETVLYAFAGGADGSLPTHGLVRDPTTRAFYGTTYGGGTAGDGTIFKLSPKGVHKVLYSFAGGTDGAGPTCDLIEDAKGRFYGTTQSQGALTYGTVFKFVP